VRFCGRHSSPTDVDDSGIRTVFILNRCAIKKMKILFQILLIVSFTSCQLVDKKNEQSYCENEALLLQGNSSFDVTFDFNLLPDKQIKHLQSQVDISLCKGVIPLNSSFELENKRIETLLMTDWCCVDSTNYLDELLLACFLVRSKQILINSSGHILLDGELVKLDSISQMVSKISKDFFWHNSYKIVAYEILWDKTTDNQTKFNVLEQTVDGYLQAANEISKTEFNLGLCQLDSTSLKELKRKFRFTVLIEKELTVPPPDGLLEIDTREPELESEK